MTSEQINAKMTATLNNAAGTGVRAYAYLDGSVGLFGTPGDVQTAAKWMSDSTGFRMTYFEVDEEDGDACATLEK